MKLKEKLVGALGGFGYILFYIISAFLTFAPLISLDFPYLIRFLIVAVVLFIPFVGDLMMLVLWAWAFVIELRHPIDMWSIIFLSAAVIYVITFIVPVLAAIFSGGRREK